MIVVLGRRLIVPAHRRKGIYRTRLLYSRPARGRELRPGADRNDREQASDGELLQSEEGRKPRDVPRVDEWQELIVVDSRSGSKHGSPAELPGQACSRLKILLAGVEKLVQNFHRVERRGNNVGDAAACFRRIGYCL